MSNVDNKTMKKKEETGVVKEYKKRGRKPTIKTEEEIREYRKKYNDTRNNKPIKKIYKECSICKITVLSQNFNRHILSIIHGKNQEILDMKCQLKKREDN